MKTTFLLSATLGVVGLASPMAQQIPGIATIDVWIGDDYFFTRGNTTTVQLQQNKCSNFNEPFNDSISAIDPTAPDNGKPLTCTLFE
ncbi:hypothetical protein DPSP01_006254 [Paraphaeosphaeria sporulosa]|uniref:Uncharacterized protein n=1 Tax=Paraphaeosphaeria sporulosa TaxID=1460663 RepID=A0A177BYF0_9PLEO|nr:uncharacterized protein CC84DRAFT_1168886 [Paraphaeosphaeria sporulosa]OAF99980.1 hypothetical protein CC84DRAFT_1168886 [Paraphaeosphaeria sporulosa]